MSMGAQKKQLVMKEIDYQLITRNVDVSGRIRQIFLHRYMCLDVWK
jgi:hypothetical protein